MGDRGCGTASGWDCGARNASAEHGRRTQDYSPPMLPGADPLVASLTDVVQSGDVEALAVLLHATPSLATERFGDDEMSRTALHVATDWPANFPRVADTIAALVAAGAPVDGRFSGPHRETPLHWAASADDVDAIDALVAAGADIEASGAVFTDGAPLSDAVVFAQWKAARRLVEHGATMTIWQAAALGEMPALLAHLDAGANSPVDITNACWHACRAGQLAAVQALVARGADLNWLGYDDLTSRAAALGSGNDALVEWLHTR